MIKRISGIYQDLDECILHTVFKEPEQDYIKLSFDCDIYYTIVRPCAAKLFDFYREIVGAENVFILTAATKDYAVQINELAKFGVLPENILSREDMVAHTYSIGYGEATCSHKSADKSNVLIDNLPPRYNLGKMSFIGIDSERYLQVRDYYGVNFADDNFEEKVREFIKERHE